MNIQIWNLGFGVAEGGVLKEFDLITMKCDEHYEDLIIHNSSYDKSRRNLVT